jgi:hypothetical protein
VNETKVGRRGTAQCVVARSPPLVPIVVMLEAMKDGRSIWRWGSIIHFPPLKRGIKGDLRRAHSESAVRWTKNQARLTVSLRVIAGIILEKSCWLIVD